MEYAALTDNEFVTAWVRDFDLNYSFNIPSYLAALMIEYWDTS